MHFLGHGQDPMFSYIQAAPAAWVAEKLAAEREAGEIWFWRLEFERNLSFREELYRTRKEEGYSHSFFFCKKNFHQNLSKNGSNCQKMTYLEGIAKLSIAKILKLCWICNYVISQEPICNFPLERCIAQIFLYVWNKIKYGRRLMLFFWGGSVGHFENSLSSLSRETYYGKWFF